MSIVLVLSLSAGASRPSAAGHQRTGEGRERRVPRLRSARRERRCDVPRGHRRQLPRPTPAPTLVYATALDGGSPNDADPEGHGTLMATLAGGQGHGLRGIWPQIKIVSIRAASPPAPGQEPTYQYLDYVEGLTEVPRTLHAERQDRQPLAVLHDPADARPVPEVRAGPERTDRSRDRRRRGRGQRARQGAVPRRRTRRPLGRGGHDSRAPPVRSAPAKARGSSRPDANWTSPTPSKTNTSPPNTCREPPTHRSSPPRPSRR